MRLIFIYLKTHFVSLNPLCKLGRFVVYRLFDEWMKSCSTIRNSCYLDKLQTIPFPNPHKNLTKFKTDATTLFHSHSISLSVTLSLLFFSLSVFPCPHQAFTCFHSVYKRHCPWTESHSINAFQQMLFSFEGLSKHNISHGKKSPNSPKVLSLNVSEPVAEKFVSKIRFQSKNLNSKKILNWVSLSRISLDNVGWATNTLSNSWFYKEFSRMLSWTEQHALKNVNSC